MKHKKRILWVAGIALAIAISQFISKAHAEAPEVPLAERSISEIVKHFADYYQTDNAVLQKVMECESQGRQSTKGDYGMSHGIFQIQTDTWRRFTKEMGETLNMTSPMDQAKVAAWAFANGHAEEWTTYVAIKKGGSYTFWYKLEKRYYTVYCKL